MNMKSQDGFRVYNQLLARDINRRTFLHAAAAGMAATTALSLPRLQSPQKGLVTDAMTPISPLPSV